MTQVQTKKIVDACVELLKQLGYSVTLDVTTPPKKAKYSGGVKLPDHSQKRKPVHVNRTQRFKWDSAKTKQRIKEAIEKKTPSIVFNTHTLTADEKPSYHSHICNMAKSVFKDTPGKWGWRTQKNQDFSKITLFIGTLND